MKHENLTAIIDALGEKIADMEKALYLRDYEIKKLKEQIEEAERKSENV